MPADVRAHLRYPGDLFRLQTALLRAPTTWWSRRRSTTAKTSGSTRRVEQGAATASPFMRHIILRLPGEKNPEFIYMTPFTPRGRTTSRPGWWRGWTATNYGKLVVYQFPKQSLVYGPKQIVEPHQSGHRASRGRSRCGTRRVRRSFAASCSSSRSRSRSSTCSRSISAPRAERFRSSSAWSSPTRIAWRWGRRSRKGWPAVRRGAGGAPPRPTLAGDSTAGTATTTSVTAIRRRPAAAGAAALRSRDRRAARRRLGDVRARDRSVGRGSEAGGKAKVTKSESNEERR